MDSNFNTSFMKKITFKASLLVLVIFYLLLGSCVSTKNITYFQTPGIDTLRESKLLVVEPEEPKIMPNDILAVTVNSLSEESNVMFNFPNITPLQLVNYPVGGAGGVNKTQPLGYTVNPNGQIDLPMAGKIKVAGQTSDEAADIIRVELSKFLKNPVVNIRILNQRITILGEVNHPGTFNLVSNNISLPEAFGFAGDLTIFGKRDNIMLIRQVKDGRKVIRLDLTKRDFLNSEYYYLKNNDVIYVEATSGKITSSDRTLQLIPVVTGVVSSFVLLLNFLIR